MRIERTATAPGPLSTPFPVLAVLLAALVQGAIIAQSPLIAKDGIGFIRIAQHLARDPIAALRAEDQHPGYPAMILAVQRITPAARPNTTEAWIASARAVSFSCGLASVLVMWLLARRMFDEQVAGVAAILFAALPLLRHNAADALSDTPHLLFYLLGAWCAAEGLLSRRPAWFAAAGAAAGLAYLVRPEGLAVAAVAAAAVLGGASLARRLPSITFAETPAIALTNQRRWTCAAALTVATLAIVVPYVAVAGKLTSKKNPLIRESPAAGLVRAGKTEGLIVEPSRGEPLPGEVPRPDSKLLACGAAVAELGVELAFAFRYFLLLPLAAGHLALDRRRTHAMPAVVATGLLTVHVTLLIALYLSAGYISHRHTMPLVALLLPCTASGLIWMAQRAAACCSARFSAGAILKAGICATVVWLTALCVRPLHAPFYPVVQAATWVKAHASQGDNLLATSRYVHFYAGLDGPLVGPETPNLQTALANPPNRQRWSYVVLEVDERNFQERDALLAAGYRQVLTLPNHPRKDWLKVLVLDGGGQADRLAGRPGELPTAARMR